MKRLLLIRHGHCFNESLSNMGKRQVSRLGEKIRVILNGEYCEMWSSTSLRATETAEILFEYIVSRTAIVEKPQLWSDHRHKENFDWLKAEIDEFKGDNLIIVTYFEYVTDFPNKFYGTSEYLVDNAAGLMITDDGQTITRI